MASEQPQRPEFKLTQGWATAEQQQVKARALRVVPVTSTGREIHLSVTPEGWRGLVIPLQHGEVANVPREFRSSSRGALRAEVAQFSTGSEATDALYVWCKDAKCNDAFTSFSVFVLDRAETDRGLGELLSESYAEFERLLGESESVDGSRLVGLVGELLVLLEGVQVGQEMVAYWAGPRGERHDFRNGKQAVEVKTSLRSELKANRVHISDWDQLEIPSGGSLHLHSIRLERVAAGALSVPKLLSEIRANLDLENLKVLDEHLSNFDRTVIDCSWEFSVKRRDTYHVVDGFPRLVPGMLAGGEAPGVSRVSYTLELDHAEPFRADWERLLTAFVGGSVDA